MREIGRSGAAQESEIGWEGLARVSSVWTGPLDWHAQVGLACPPNWSFPRARQALG